ncbi:MAG: methyltransferase domain-containing protein [Bacteroidetes bacterium]|nr:methyltransferase domain-containing protein [Bacteroidota bacterium]
MFFKSDKKCLTTEDYFESDDNFNSIYPRHIRQVASKHWTPLEVVKKAASFLAASPAEKILDIGSGAGKFCLAAAHHFPQYSFYGVEQRADLVQLCNELKKKLAIENVTFINENITQTDWAPYHHFYFYNSFYENITGAQKIDEAIPYSEKLYEGYNKFLLGKLMEKPSGTRIVTYHSFGLQMPPDYLLVNNEMDDYLKYWVKE